MLIRMLDMKGQAAVNRRFRLERERQWTCPISVRWRIQWNAFLSAPYIILPPAIILAVATWWFRGTMFQSTIAGLREQIKAFEARLKLADDRAAWANEVRDDIARQFKDFKAEIASGGAWKDALTARVATMGATIDKLEAANNAVRSAIGVSVGASVAAASSMRAQLVEADKDS
jgi:outer membrane murein-binding lipoprotein Lpp